MSFRGMQSFFITIGLSIFLLSCSSGGGDSKSEPLITQTTSIASSIKFREFNSTVAALSKISIDTTAELIDTFNNQDPLEFFLDLKAQDSSLQPEELLNLMKALEYEITFVALEANGTITPNALESLKNLDLSIIALKSGPFREWSAADANATLNANSQDIYNRQQLIAYNNDLAAFGQAQLSLQEYLALKNAISKTAVLFVNFGEAMQNVDTNSSAAATRSFSRDLNTLGVGPLGELNPMDEAVGALNEAPTPYLEFPPNNYKACHGLERMYPFQVMGTQYTNESVPLEFIDTSIPLLGDEDGKRYFQINEKGLAELLLFNKSTSSVTLSLEHKDHTLTSITLEPRQKQKVFIPVMDSDICVPYYLTKDDLKIEATILKLHQATTMQATFDAARGAYDLENRYAISQEGDTFLQASLTKFTLIDVVDGSKRQLFFDKVADIGMQVMQYIAEAPSGKLYSEVSAGDGSMEIDAENGDWLIYSFPMSGASYEEYEFDASNEYVKFNTMQEYANGYDTREYTLSISTNKVGNLKKFVIAEMKNAEFSHDGEGYGQAAEVTLSLHSNMAPKLELGSDLANVFGGNIAYSAQQCWITHGRDVNQFNVNQACYEMKEGMQEIYEEFMCKNYGSCIQGNESITPLSIQSATFKQALFIWKTQEINKQLNDERFKLMFDTYASIYDEWKNSVVQINDINFPAAYHYGIQDSIVETNATQPLVPIIHDYYHPNIPINIPVFAVTKERMSTSSVPFAFEYSAHDADEVDSSAQLFAVVKLVVNQALAVVTGNYAALVCNTVDTMQEMRQNEIAGEDDPIGEADFFLNRFSSEDSFYGINADRDLEFAISGLATIPNHYTSFDKKLEYAALTCNIGGAVVGAYNLYNSIGTLISGDFYSGLGLNELRLDALEGVDENSEIFTAINEAFDSIENGTASADVFEALKASTQLDGFANGIDIFNSISDATADLGGLGGAGHNVMRSEANYFFSSFEDRKTRSNVVVKEIGGQPVTNIKIDLDSIKIQDNFEDGNAEVKLRTRVGVVSDQTPEYQGSFASNAPFMLNGSLIYDNGSNGYATLPNLPFKGYLLKNKNFNGVSDGDELDVDNIDIYDASYPANNNAAAIFVEIGLYEGDGGGVDDDMIGVYSKTFYLEDIYNIVDGERWTHPGGRVQRLRVWAPVYNAKNLATSVELLNAQNREKQLAHNSERINNPSAYISFTIEVTLGDYTDYDAVDVGVTSVDGDPNHGKGVMDMSLVNFKEISSLRSEELKLQDVYQKQALLLDSTHGIRVAKIDSENQLSWRTTINASNLPSGDANLLDDLYTSSFRYEPIHGMSFIDDNNFVMLQRHVHGVDETRGVQLLVMNIGENNSSVTIGDRQLLEANAANMTTMRINGNHLKVFVSIPNLADNTGIIDIYDVGANSIDKVGSYTLLYTPTDILAIDDKTLLVKSEKLKHRYFDTTGYEHDEYWTKELYLHLLELDSNTLNAKGEKQYTYMFDAYSEFTGRVWPAIATSNWGMRNINSGLLNRIVYTGVHNYQNDISATHLNLVYNSDTESYGFGSERKTRILTSVENPEYAYYVDRYLDAYPSDLSRDGEVRLKEADFFGDEQKSFHYAINAEFIDSRYLLGLSDVTQIIGGTTSTDSELMLIDTLYVHNTTPIVTGDDFNKTHILNYANSYTAGIDFTLTDAERSIDDFNVTFNIIELENNTTIFTGTDTAIRVHNDSNFSYEAALECQSNGSCHIDITYPIECTSLTHKFEVNIQDYDIRVTKTFNVQLQQTKPQLYLSDLSITSYRYVDNYSEENVDFTSTAENGCASIGFVNRPTWTSTQSSWSLDDPDEILRLTTLAQLGDAGEYDVGVYAYNEDFESEHINLHIIVQEPDIIPDNFTFSEVNDVNQSELVNASIVIDGINAPANVSIVNGEYSLDDVLWTTDPGQVENGNTLYVRHTSSPDYLGEVVTTLSIGGASATLISRVIEDPSINDSTPNAFSFIDVTDAELSSIVTSTVTITGINIASPLSILNGEYSLDAGTSWSTAPIEINNNDTILVRHTTSAEFNTAVETTLSVGEVSDIFSSRTQLMPPPSIDNYPTTSIEMNELFSFTPLTSGGAIASWSIQNKPAWLDFNASNGALQGSSANAGDFEDIKIIATNASGTAERLFTIRVQALSYPYVNGGSHNLDETNMSFTFSDDEAWRNAITSLSISVDHGASIALSQGSDYEINAGEILLYVNGTNNIPTNSGQWDLNIEATNYYDNNVYIWMTAGQADLSHAQNTLTLTDAPFAKGKSSSVKFQLQDRFTNLIEYEDAYFDISKVDTTATFREPYSIKDVDATFYTKTQERQTVYSNGEGWVEASILVPGCVDSGDGFSLSLKDKDERDIGSFDFLSNSDTCVNVEWIKRFDINETSSNLSKMKVVSDGSGNLYIADNYNNNGIYFAKIDKNGVTKWEETLTTGTAASLGKIVQKGEYLYISATTTEYLGADGGVNAGGIDAVLIKVAKDSGNTIYIKQSGVTGDDNCLGLDTTVNGVVLNLQNRSTSPELFTKLSFLDDGIFDGEKSYETYYSIGSVVNVGSENTFGVYSTSTYGWDENLTEQWNVRNARSGDYFASGALWDDNGLYLLGITQADKYFNDTLPVNDVGFQVLAKRDYGGNFIWSHVFDKWYAEASAKGVSLGDVLYVAYSNDVDNGPYAERHLNIATLNSFDGTTISEQSFEAGTHMSGQVPVGDKIEPKDLAADATLDSIYIAGTASNKLSDTNPADGAFFIMKMIKDDNASDTRSGYTRDSYHSTVNDYDNNLQWDDTNTTYPPSDSYSNVTCYDGWRLPTRSELQTTVDTALNPAIESIFIRREADRAYWTSEASDVGSYFTLQYLDKNFSIDSYPETDWLYYRCVRDLPR